MSASIFQRGFALCLSAVLTLTVLGSINHLAQPDEAAAAAWAQKNVAPASRA